MKTHEARQAMLNARGRMQRRIADGKGASMVTLEYEEACDTLMYTTMQQYQDNPVLNDVLAHDTVQNICEMSTGDLYYVLEKYGKIPMSTSSSIVEFWETQLGLENWLKEQVD